LNLLLDANANTLLMNSGGDRAAMIAHKKGYREQAYLIGSRSIYQAIAESNLDAALELVDVGINVNTHNDIGTTPLLIAVCHGDLIHVKRLLAVHNIDVNLTENDGWSPLFFAINYNHVEVVRLLLQHGANRYHVSKAGFTADILASKSPEIQAILNYQYEPY
jgi:ankyrin repeat protein